MHIIWNKVVFLRTLKEPYKDKNMYWTLELASKLEDAPWPATKDELIDYAMRSGAPLEVIENLQELEDEGDVYETIEDVWPENPTKEDFLFNEDEYKAESRRKVLNNRLKINGSGDNKNPHFLVLPPFMA